MHASRELAQGLARISSTAVEARCFDCTRQSDHVSVLWWCLVSMYRWCTYKYVWVYACVCMCGYICGYVYIYSCVYICVYAYTRKERKKQRSTTVQNIESDAHPGSVPILCIPPYGLLLCFFVVPSLCTSFLLPFQTTSCRMRGYTRAGARSW